jgi:hypothetical protein
MSRAAAGQMSASVNVDEIMQPLRELLTEPVAALGGADPDRDADAVFLCTAAAMRRYVGSADGPSRDDIRHLVRFCLHGLGVT